MNQIVPSKFHLLSANDLDWFKHARIYFTMIEKQVLTFYLYTCKF